MAVPKSFAHFDILRREDGTLLELGRGAMGTTYKAVDRNLRATVALKVISPAYLESDVARQRFVREARAAARLRHPNVATVFHLGEEGGVWFYAMEFVDGETVESLIKRDGPVAPHLALHIAAQVARALGAAHAEGLIHRDIKPANLMLAKDGDDRHVKVIDFGLAKAASHSGDEDAATVSMAGFVGTPLYASPEQLEERELDIRSDIYSLGATLWYMLAGQAPFSGTMAQVMSQHLAAPPPFEKVGDWPSPVIALLKRMLEKDPANRPQDPKVLRREIEAALAALNLGPAPAETIAPGGTFAGFALSEELPETAYGRVFRASGPDGPVEIVLCQGPLSPGALDVFARARSAKVDGLLCPERIENVGGRGLLVFPPSGGFSLADILRARRELPWAEALPLLRQISLTADAAAEAGIAEADFSATSIRVVFAGDAPQPATPVHSWSAHTVRVPIRIPAEMEDDVNDPDLTIAGTSAGPPVQAVARLTYELLGGNLSRIALRWAPLTTLSEQGNAALKRGLSGTGFSTAAEMIRSIADAESGNAPPPRSSPAPIQAPAPAMPPQRPTTPEPPAIKRVGPTPPSSGAPAPKLAAIAAMLLAFAAAALGIAWWLLLRPDPSAVPPPEPLPLATRELRPDSTTEPEPTPTPGPSRPELAKAALDAAQAFEDAEDWPACIRAYLDAAEAFPETEAPKLRLNMILNRLANKRPKITPPELAKMRAGLERAAGFGIVPAQFLLGETLRGSDPAGALTWYSAAAESGHAPSMTVAGLMYSNGDGTPRDLVRAAEWFAKAAGLNDETALFALGECYLLGKGVDQDPARAVLLFREAAELGNTRAMNALGRCYHKGTGVSADFAQALRWFQAAADAGYADAWGNLAVLHMNGEGVPRNAAKGAALFHKGAESGSAHCMFQLALCYRSGAGVKQDPAAADRWLESAAKAGHPDARRALQSPSPQ